MSETMEISVEMELSHAIFLKDDKSSKILSLEI